MSAAPVVVDVVREAAGTRYRVVIVVAHGEAVISLPDLRWSYSVGACAPPSASYLRAVGLRRGDCPYVASILASIWPRSS